MDGLSLIVGGMLGMLAGWAFSYASFKQREATERLDKASRFREEIFLKRGEAQHNEERSLADKIQGFFLYTLGLCLMFALVVILFGSIA